MQPLTSIMVVESLFAALVISGAFWVGVLAAKRLRDLGENDPALAEGDMPLALPPSPTGPGRDVASRRIRQVVAERLQDGLLDPGGAALERDASDLSLEGLRVGDIVSVVARGAEVEGDFIVDGLLRLREGSTTRMVLVTSDGGRIRWFVSGEDDSWISVGPSEDHGLRGEPPRNLELSAGSYALRRRGQSSVAGLGRHGRPEANRVATYLFEGPSERLAWIERWGDTLFVGEGVPLPGHAVSFLPGS
jgi:hypothetical protein